jgi:NAD-dependent deacetylase
MARIFVLTGAGVSAESGLGVFRGESGLWRDYRPEEVANIEAWRSDPQLVWQFYSMRREKHNAARPNPAHFALADLERRLGDDFFLCTQNVDRLHEMAGSERVAHIHGKLYESKCDTCAKPPFFDDSLNTGKVPRCECGGRIRPNVVWFGEALPTDVLAHTMAELDRCDIFLAIGTSGAVEPVASFVQRVKHRQLREKREIRTIFCGLDAPENGAFFDDFHIGKASTTITEILQELRLTPGTGAPMA